MKIDQPEGEGVPCDQVNAECFCGEEKNVLELRETTISDGLIFKGKCLACGRSLLLKVSAARVRR